MTNPTPESRRRIATLSAKGLCRRYHGADCDCWQAECRSCHRTFDHQQRPSSVEAQQ